MNRWIRIGVVVAFIILLLVAVIYLQEIFMYLGIAGVISLFGRPIMSFLQAFHIGKLKLPDWLCALLTILFFYCVIALFFAAFVPLLIAQINLVFSIDPNQVVQGLEDPLNRLNAWIEKYSFANNDGTTFSEKLRDELTGILNPNIIGNVFGSVFGFVNNIFSFVIAVFAITFISFFFLSDKDLLYRAVFCFQTN